MSDSSSETASEELNLPELGIVKVSPFKSDIIEVLIGPHEERFYVHKDAICSASPFFRRCLCHDMREASTKTVTLPEDDPESFQCILKWVYTKIIEKPQDPDYAHSRRLFRAYVLADKLCMEVLCNLLMDIILEWHKMMYSLADVLAEIPDSILKEFLVAQLAWDILINEIWDDKEPRESLEEFFQKGGPEVVRVMTASWKFDRFGDDDPPCNAPKCRYHKHIETEKCKDDNGNEELMSE